MAVWLRRRGYQLLERQFRCRYGEIDLIARAATGRSALWRSRPALTAGLPRPGRPSLPPSSARLRTAAALYLASQGGDCPCRFDVAEVYPGAQGNWETPEISYITNAF